MPTLHRHRSGEQGFVLPLAMGASLVLLLGSLSAHTVSLQGRLQGIREQQISNPKNWTPSKEISK